MNVLPGFICCLTRWSRIVIGVLAVVGIWMLSSRLVVLLHLPVSGGVIGLLILLTLLLTGWMPAGVVKPGARWLLAELLLFFIPAVVSIVQYGSLLRHDGLRLLIIIVTSTVLVMVTAGIVVELVSRIELRTRSGRHDQGRPMDPVTAARSAPKGE